MGGRESPEVSARRAREYYWKNRDEVLLRYRAHRIATIDKQLWKGAKRRARDLGLPFEIEIFDVVVPEFCPVLGVRLEVGLGKVQWNSPTLDRIRPELGYVRGNIMVISFRANTLKGDASPEELMKVATFYRDLI